MNLVASMCTDSTIMKENSVDGNDNSEWKRLDRRKSKPRFTGKTGTAPVDTSSRFGGGGEYNSVVFVQCGEGSDRGRCG